MIILGIDPGTATTGWGVVQRQNAHTLSFVGCGTIETKAHTPMPSRLAIIYEDLQFLFKKFKPDMVVVEELFFNTNATTALVVGQARGVVLLTAQLYKAEIISYTPLQVKMAITGYGRADKKQMQEMVKTLLKLPKIPKPDDAADALAIALTHGFTLRRQ
jgi:crossover junction endodeoxyribonuclease RuvC